MRKRNTELIKLTNGCERTGVYFSPKGCMDFTSKSKFSKVWFVECRFYDPKFKDQYPNGFQYRKKFSKDSLRELKIFAEIFKEEMEHKLDELKFNPISKTYMNNSLGELNPDLNFMTALWKVRDKIPFSEDYIGLSRQLLNLIEKVIPELGYGDLRIIDTKIWHVKNILEAIYTTNSVFNKHRSCLKTLFNELLEYGCVEFNPVGSLSKKAETPAIRELLTDRKKAIVLQYLHDNFPEFYRYANIFHYSGARSTELFRLQAKYVDIENQEYKVLIKKRRKFEWETKVIIPAAIPYWRQILLECNSEDDYVFSKGLRPGPTKINSSQIEKRWRRNVKESDKIIDPISKKPIKVTENFYSWKHLFLDKLDQLQNSQEAPIIPINLAQGMASHLSPETTKKYTVGKSDRNKEYLKKISIK
ncbi:MULTISPECIES: phage integrase family protein [Chryseobacterium]|nr:MULTISPECIES: phage integrase family protein [Chryseobacterium]